MMATFLSPGCSSNQEIIFVRGSLNSRGYFREHSYKLGVVRVMEM